MVGRRKLLLGALLAGLGVALGAFAAHGLEDRLIALGYQDDLPQRLEWFETGVRYQLYHALGLLILGTLVSQSTGLPASRFAAWAFVTGILLFSGSLYVMALTTEDWRKLGAVVPLGGLAFLIGWTTMAYGAWRSGKP